MPIKVQCPDCGAAAEYHPESGMVECTTCYDKIRKRGRFKFRFRVNLTAQQLWDKYRIEEIKSESVSA